MPYARCKTCTIFTWMPPAPVLPGTTVECEACASMNLVMPDLCHSAGPDFVKWWQRVKDAKQDLVNMSIIYSEYYSEWVRFGSVRSSEFVRLPIELEDLKRFIQESSVNKCDLQLAVFGSQDHDSSFEHGSQGILEHSSQEPDPEHV